MAILKNSVYFTYLTMVCGGKGRTLALLYRERKRKETFRSCCEGRASYKRQNAKRGDTSASGKPPRQARDWDEVNFSNEL